jgi:hypothetical protein
MRQSVQKSKRAASGRRKPPNSKRRSGGGRSRQRLARNWGKEAWLGFARPRKKFGVAVAIAVTEHDVTGDVVRWARMEQSAAKPGRRPKAAFLDKTAAEAIAHLFAGLAHPDRVRLARAILVGSNSHKQLSEAVGLKTGPLYHHVRELERAGLLSIVSRNLYALTDAGRIALFVGTVLGVHMQGGRSKVWQTEHTVVRAARLVNRPTGDVP